MKDALRIHRTPYFFYGSILVWPLSITFKEQTFIGMGVGGVWFCDTCIGIWPEKNGIWNYTFARRRREVIFYENDNPTPLLLIKKMKALSSHPLRSHPTDLPPIANRRNLRCAISPLDTTTGRDPAFPQPTTNSRSPKASTSLYSVLL